MSARRQARAAALAAWIEDVEWMAATGETVPGAAARLHINPDRLRNKLYDQGRRDLVARLLANADPGWTGPRGSIRSTGRPTRRAA